jgi:ribosomal protein L21
MKKITLTTVLLILLTSISGLAQNEKNSLNITEIIVLNFEQDAKVNQDLKINFEVINSTEDNKVSVIVKYETFKSSSRRSRVKNIINFLKNSEKKQGSSIALC